MQQLRSFLFSGLYLLVVSFPALAFAQGAGLPKKIVPCDGVACKCSDLVTLAQNLINVGVFIFIVFAAVMFAYAGFLKLSNEAIGRQAEANQIFTNVTIGLVILLSAWLLVDTLMKSLLGGSFGPWNAIAPLDAACRAIGIQ